jgi:uncharacterized protein
MGPTNIALVKLYEADQQLREAQSRLDAVTRNVRIQERRINELNEKLTAAQTRLRSLQSSAANLELDLKTRESRIERLRTQQQSAKNNKEYQAFLIEISTEKNDRNKIEEETIKAMESVERASTELKEMTTLIESESAKLETMRGEITDKIATLQAEIDLLKPARDSALGEVPPKARDAFDRLADRFEGEAMSAIAKPDRRREEYICTVCNMSLVVDVYNRLHSRDELVFCPSCHRILYIPEDLPPETAVHKKKAPKEPKTAKADIPPAPQRRQENAADVVASVTPQEEQNPADPPS